MSQKRAMRRYVSLGEGAWSSDVGFSQCEERDGRRDFSL